MATPTEGRGLRFRRRACGSSPPLVSRVYDALRDVTLGVQLTSRSFGDELKDWFEVLFRHASRAYSAKDRLVLPKKSEQWPTCFHSRPDLRNFQNRSTKFLGRKHFEVMF